MQDFDGCSCNKTHPYIQVTTGSSQNHIKGVLNSADPCSVQTQIHYLAKHLATKDNAHHTVYDYLHYIVKRKSLDTSAL